jgi:3-hydroxyisobutyrate dehydrogenase-like beta-hydroxyacid dehydrogenase
MYTDTLGFIGLGRMGAPMAARLLQAGHPVSVFDTNPDAVQSLVGRGATAGTDATHVASNARIVLMCLPTPRVVRAVALGDRGIAQGSRARVVIDLSTTGPAMARVVAAGLGDHGITLVDAPVTGGLAGATAGTLTLMVSCPQDVFREVEPLLAALGRVVYTGSSPGLAQTAKLANNLLSAAALAASAEAVALGVKAGLDPRVLLDIINAGSGRNSATEDKFPRAILPRTFDFGMDTGLFLKDVRLSLDESGALGVPAIVGSAVEQMFTIAAARFGAASDFTSVVKVVEEWAGVEIRG